MKVPSELDLTLPARVREVAERVEAAGAALWVVGGAVRDHVLGVGVDDWDLATAMQPEQLQDLFPEAIDVDPRYGRVGLSRAPGEIVITTFREEGDYHDHRHPSTVRFVESLEADAQRRDFTINAIYLRALTGELRDPCGGWQDLACRQVRVIGAPAVRMREDPLRMLRAIKFALALDFKLAVDCLSALRSEAAMLGSLSPARRYAELQAIFTGVGRGQALQLLQDSGLILHCLAEVAAMDRERFELASRVLAHVPGNQPVLSWAAVLHLLADLEQVDLVLKRLAVPRGLRRTIVEICQSHARIEDGEWPRSLHAAQAHRRFMRARLRALGREDALPVIEESLNRAKAVQSLVSGADVLALGVAAGPMVGEALAQLAASFSGQEMPGRQQALERLRKLISGRIKAVGRQVDKERGNR